MRVTIDIPDDLLREAMKHSVAMTKRQAVLIAIEEYNRRWCQARLTKHLGTFRDFITLAELKAARLARLKRHGTGRPKR